MLGVVAVITNCALIGMSAKSAHWLPEMSTVNAILMFVAIEVRTCHSLLCGFFFLCSAEKQVIVKGSLVNLQTANKLERSYAIVIAKARNKFRDSLRYLYTKQSEMIAI